MEPKEKKAFEPSGLVPRSIVRTFERFRQQLLPGSETAAIREYRISRYQVLVSVRCLFTLLIIPIATNWLVSSWLLSPLVEHFWNTQQNEIFLNSYQEERAFAELESFSEKLFFESLLNTTNTINVNSVQSKPLTQYEAKGYKGLGVPFASAKVNPLNKLRVNPLASARVIPAFYKSSICAAKVNSPFNKFSKAWDPSVCDPLPLTQCGAKGYKGYGVCAGMRNNSYFNKRKNSCVSVRNNSYFNKRNSEGITFAPAEGIVLTNDSFSCNSTRNSKEITLATQMEDLQKAGGALYPLYPLAPGIELRRSYEGVLLYKSSICKSCNNELIQYEKYLPENKNSLTHNKSLIWVRSQVNTILSEFLRNSFGVSYPLPEYTKLRGIRGKEELLRQQEEFYTPYPVQSKRVVEVRGQQLKDTGAKTWGTEVKAPSSLFVPIESTYDNSLKIKEKVQNKILELAIYYNQQTIISITNIIGDIVSLVTLGCLFIWMKPEITILKSFLIEAIYSLSDTTKSFLLILLTDLLVGFHSPRGWETALELLLKHFGLPENQDFVFLFVATFPVLLDTVFKYWIFRHLNKISPSTVATYHSMIE